MQKTFKIIEGFMDGVLIINKPKGYTSHDIVNILRKELNTKKVGHAGTLDPNATGVLPILIGKATKISKYLIEHDKQYSAIIKLGERTDTGDSEGKIIEKLDNIEEISNNQIEKILKKFIGKHKQKPPIYSAIKINGKKAYEYARSGEKIELPERDIEIYSIKLVKYENEEITFNVKCSKGTYIRTLCEDIAKQIGTVGYMKNLTREKVDEFDIKDSIKIENLNEAKERIISIEQVFKKSSEIELNEKELQLFLNGVLLTYNLKDDIYKIYNNKYFIGIGIVKNKLLKRDIVL